MLIEHLKSSRNGLLVAALVMSLGGVGAAQSAETGVSPPPLKAPPVLPGAKPAVPMTSPALPGAKPAVPMTSPALPGAKPAMPMTAPATSSAKPAPVTAGAAGVSGNPDGSCPESAPIKGSRSKIYHAPEGRNYAKTKAKLCFASAEAAEQAGYRAPKK
ncbi:MAG: hypothetical protein IPN66_13300 [Candidatus Competibacteraceae bacterium]|nr:hypothetical protein [Candidatus Competibacteraceae bacterium]MBK8898151.1 hypothetical protein [Candidatus Competibacteraceae bacterium]